MRELSPWSNCAPFLSELKRWRGAAKPPDRLGYFPHVGEEHRWWGDGKHSYVNVDDSTAEGARQK